MSVFTALGLESQSFSDGSARSWLARLVERLGTWLDRARERRELSTLDPRALRDIGLTSADVAREAAKPFWRG